MKNFLDWWNNNKQYFEVCDDDALSIWDASQRVERNACIKAAEDAAMQYDCDIPQLGDKDYRRGAMTVVAAIRRRSNA